MLYEVKKMEFMYKDNYIYLNDGNQVVGYIYYQKINYDIIDVSSTFVSEDYRGQGIAGKLFDELVQFARKNHYQIIPSCHYIKKKIENNREYQDIYCKEENIL